MEKNNLTIAHSGLNKNNVYFSQKCLRNCVRKVKNRILPIYNNFDDKSCIGEMKNFKYVNGTIIADIKLNKSLRNKVIRCAYSCGKIKRINPRRIGECELVFGGLITRSKDAEKDLIKENK